LQWSKFQSQGVHAKPQYIELTALLNDVVDLQKYSAAEKKIILSNALDQKLFVYADEEMVKSLLKTILQNIVKLSDAGATIAITGNKDKQNGWLQANYTGQMPLKHTFILQSQTVDYGSETTELGKAIILGWMLCHTLVKVNNGSICVEDISDESFQVFLKFPLEEVKV
jgi:two-component system sensor histidine kinase/response regulator